MNNFNINIEFSECTWDWSRLGFESEEEFRLWRFFQYSDNTMYQGYELIEDLYDGSATTVD